MSILSLQAALPAGRWQGPLQKSFQYHMYGGLEAVYMAGV